MNNIYYKIWADAILSFKKHHPNNKNWKSTLFVYITWIHTMNLWIILLWLKFYNILNLPLLHLELFPGKLLNIFLSFAIEFSLPLGIINYFLVFHKRKYEKITQKNGNLKLRYAPLYSFSIAILTFISIVTYGILN